MTVGGRLRPWLAVSATCLGVLVPDVSGAADFDVSRYRPAQLVDIGDDLPGHHGVSVTPDVPIRTRVSYAGEFRRLPEDGRRLIGAWGDSMGVTGMLEVFRREARVRQGGREYWLPIQEALATAMEAELRAGEMIEVFVISIGRVDGRAVFLVNAFDHEGHQGHRR